MFFLLFPIFFLIVERIWLVYVIALFILLIMSSYTVFCFVFVFCIITQFTIHNYGVLFVCSWSQPWYFGVTPGSVYRNHFWQCLENHIGCLALNLGLPCSKQALYQFYYLSCHNYCFSHAFCLSILNFLNLRFAFSSIATGRWCSSLEFVTLFLDS